MSDKISRGLKRVSDSVNQAYAIDGVHYLVDNNASPVSKYDGFIVTGETTVIASITYIDSTKQGGNLLLLTLPQGMYIPVPGLFSTMTLTSGNVILLKKI